MFSGFTGDEYPDRAVLLRTLLEGIERLDAQGRLDLTYRALSALRQAGYVTALGRGPWPVPRLPLEMLRPHPSLAGLARFWYGPNALTPPPAPPPACREPMTQQQRLRWALGEIIRNDDARALLLSVARRPGGLQRRRLQQHHRRLRAARFNAALTTLRTREIVKISTAGVVQFVEGAAEALHALETSVRHAVWARAQARRRETALKREPREIGMPRRRVRRTCRRRHLPNRHQEPHAWARSMLGRKGGLARQRQARMRGENATAKATIRRIALTRRRSSLRD
jgi:hypothetical protein